MPSEKVSPFFPPFLSATVSRRCGFHVVTEPMLAAAARRRVPFSKDAVMIDSNENPLGPGQAARDAISAVIPLGGRYLDNLTEDLVNTLPNSKASTRTTHTSFLAPAPRFALPSLPSLRRRKSYVTADPGYEAGMFALAATEARVVKFRLRKLTRMT